MWWWWCVLRENVIVDLIIYQSERGAALPLLWITPTRRCSWTAQSLWTTTQAGSSDISYIRQGWIEGQPSCLLRGSLGISWETRRKPVLLSADLRACMKENFHEVSKITVTLMPHKTGSGVLKPPEKTTGLCFLSLEGQDHSLGIDRWESWAWQTHLDYKPTTGSLWWPQVAGTRTAHTTVTGALQMHYRCCQLLVPLTLLLV